MLRYDTVMISPRANKKRILEKKDRNRKKREASASTWGLVTQFVSAIILILIGVFTFCITCKQLEEIKKRPFLSLGFVTENSLQVDYSLFYPKGEVFKQHTFSLGIVNTGPRFSQGGEVILVIPRYLELDTIYTLTSAEKRLNVEISKRELLETSGWIGCQVYSITFDGIYPGGGISVRSIDLPGYIAEPVLKFRVGLSGIPTEKDSADYLREWSFFYLIYTKDDDGLYSQRAITAYFLPKFDSLLFDSLQNENYNENQYDKRYRIPKFDVSKLRRE